MRPLILSYLTKNYELDVLQKKHVGIYPKVEDKVNRDLRYGSELLEELISIFYLEEEVLKDLVKYWAKGNNLDFYWTYKGITFPNVANITASLISHDLVSIQPMGAPQGHLFFMEPVFSGTTEPNINERTYEVEENSLNQRWQNFLQIMDNQNDYGELDHPDLEV